VTRRSASFATSSPRPDSEDCGLYVGCGNGRNLLPLLNAGLDLTGLDISRQAIAQVRARRPDRDGRLIVGDLSALPPGARYDLVVGIQVFQHGTRAQARQHLAAAAARVRPGGLLCVRVNAAGTDVEHPHRRLEEHGDGSFSVRYRGSPKAGLDIHFFTAAELATVVGDALWRRAAAPAAEHPADPAGPRPVVPVGGHLGAPGRLGRHSGQAAWECARARRASRGWPPGARR
jgi:SAM-dependent methyltransferase